MILKLSFTPGWRFRQWPFFFRFCQSGRRKGKGRLRLTTVRGAADVKEMSVKFILSRDLCKTVIHNVVAPFIFCRYSSLSSLRTYRFESTNFKMQRREVLYLALVSAESRTIRRNRRAVRATDCMLGWDLLLQWILSGIVFVRISQKLRFSVKYFVIFRYSVWLNISVNDFASFSVKFWDIQ